MDDTCELILEVYTKSGLTDKLIGSCRVCSPSQISPEELIDRVIDLELPSTLKSKHKEALDSRMGNVRLRLLYSKEHEIPLRPPPNASSIFSYREHYRNMRTGDLILYSGVGSTDAIGKILSGTRYSRVGTIVRLPNKYTGAEKIYVFEVTRNLGRELDAFRETAEAGASLFELFTHLHAVSATDIWWVPLKAPLDPTSCANMIDWVKETACRRQTAELPAVPPEVDEFFNRYELSLIKHPYAIAELCSASVATQALRLGGRRMPFTNFISCAQLISSDCFENPVLIRERSQAPMPPFYPPGMDLSMVKGAGAAARRATVSNSGRDSSPTNGPNGNSSGNSNGPLDDIIGNTVVAGKLRSGSQANGIRAPQQAPQGSQQYPNQHFAAEHDAYRPSPNQEQHPVIQSPQPAPYGGVAAPYPQVFSATPPPYQMEFEDGEAHSPNKDGGFMLQTVEPPRAYRQPHADLPIQPPGPSRAILPNPSNNSGELNVPAARGSAHASPQGSASPASISPASSPRSNGEDAPISSSPSNEPLTNAAPVEPQPVQQVSESAAVISAPPPVAAKPTKPPKPPKKPRDAQARPLTQKPGALASQSKEEDSASNPRSRAVSSGNKPRLLAAPTARALTATEGVSNGQDANGSNGADGNIEIVVGPPLPEDEIVSPRARRYKTPRGSKPFKREEDGTKSDGKKTKRKGKEEGQTSPRADTPVPPGFHGENGASEGASTAANAPSATGGSSTPETERKKRKTAKSNAPPPVPLKPATLRAAPSLPPSPRDKVDSPLAGTEETHTSPPVSPKIIDDGAVVLSTYEAKPARMQWTFDAMSDTELSVPEGEKVTVLGVSEEWALVEWNGKKGAVPVAFLDLNISA